MNINTSKIPLNRLILYGCLIACFPLLLLLPYFSQKRSNYEALEAKERHLYEEITLLDTRQAGNRSITTNYKEANRDYIDEEVTHLPLLQSELKQLKDERGYLDARLTKRMEFLEKNNHLDFSQGNIVNYQTFQEHLETLKQPVEVDGDDVSAILFKIEGIPESPPDKPQILFTKFHLERKKEGTALGETFQLNMQLLVREFK